MAETLGIIEESSNGRDVECLSLRRLEASRSLYRFRAQSQLVLRRRRPQGMVIRHGDTPVSHRAIGVLGNRLEHSAGLFELEGVEHGDGIVEGTLDVFGAGCLEPNVSHHVSDLRGVAGLFNVAGIHACQKRQRKNTQTNQQ